ncbi:MAG: type II secretion system protein [Candidatus Sumerlaeia bacterium]|nr:type II secretion system protein [Candidatus Sumerlaeia bacterium]
MIKSRSKKRGITLVEVLVSVSLIAIISVWTMDIIANGRSLQGRARDKADLVSIARMEMDQIRVHGTDWTSGTITLEPRGEWPVGTSVSRTITPGVEGFLLLEVEAMRDTADGPVTASLHTLLGGHHD